jgi:hypothetical protein
MTGTAHVEDVVLTRGEFSSFASSGTGERLFCAKCGTPLAFRSTTEPLIWMSAGSIDDPTLLMPDHQSGSESRLPWLDAALQTEPRLSGWGNPEAAGRPYGRPDNYQHPDHDTPEWPTIG